MNKQEFFRSLNSIEAAKKSFEYMESRSYNTIDPWVELFGLPVETHSIGCIQKVRSSLISAISFYYGVKHLKGKKFEVLGLKELDRCKEITRKILEFESSKYKQMYSFLNEIKAS